MLFVSQKESREWGQHDKLQLQELIPEFEAIWSNQYWTNQSKISYDQPESCCSLQTTAEGISISQITSEGGKYSTKVKLAWLFPASVATVC